MVEAQPHFIHSPSSPRPPHRSGRGAWLQQSFPAAQPARTKKVSDPVRAGVHWHPRARQSREIYASTSVAHTSDLRSREPSMVGRERCRNPFTSSCLCPGCSFGFYLSCSSSVLNWHACVWSSNPVSPTSSAARVPVQTFLNPSSGPDE